MSDGYVRAALRDMARLGVDLPADVEVRLAEFAAGSGMLGRAVMAVRWNGAQEVRQVDRIEVARGLPAVLHASVALHELTHARLHLAGGPALEPWHEEGLCELVSITWLCSCNTPASRTVLRLVFGNQVQPYRRGLRIVVTAARAHGVEAVLRSAETDGCLPRGDAVGAHGADLSVRGNR